MKARIIPAQITTVEDKIAGNFNFTQILLFMIPLFWGMIMYVLFPPSMHFVWYKLPLIFIIAVTSLILSLRIKEKLILNWLLILLRYNLRPKYYVFNKNDLFLRPVESIPDKSELVIKFPARKKNLVPAPSLSSGVYEKGLSFKSYRKGGFNAVFEQEQ